jgi:hypothetical protein
MKHVQKFIEFNLFEGIKQGAKGDPYEYKEESGKYYTRKKGAPKWILTRGNVEKEIKRKIFPAAPSSPKDPLKPLKFEPYNPYKLSQDSHDSQKYQRDTFDPYSQQNLKQKNIGELKSQQFAKGIVPLKKESKIDPHYRIFSDFLVLRKNPITSSDFTKEELLTMKEMVKKANPGSTPKNVNFPALADIHFGKVLKGEEKQTGIDKKKSIAYVLGNAQVVDRGNYYKVTDVYDFNNYQKNPEKYSLKEMPSTISTAFKKLYAGNLVQGVEELASYYQKLGYKGIPVSIDVPKNLI